MTIAAGGTRYAVLQRCNHLVRSLKLCLILFQPYSRRLAFEAKTTVLILLSAVNQHGLVPGDLRSIAYVIVV